jgi:hypothetical protein
LPLTLTLPPLILTLPSTVDGHYRGAEHRHHCDDLPSGESPRTSHDFLRQLIGHEELRGQGTS